MPRLQNMSSEFARKPRSLKELKRWKATEFRAFLLYTGPVVLRDAIPKQKYQHFLTLTVAITCLLNNEFLESRNEFGNSLLKHFVKTTLSIQLYGPEYISHNFHNLLHLADDAKSG